MTAESIFENNVEAIDAWNGVLFDKFTQFRDLLTTGLRIHGDYLLSLTKIEPGWKVLDVGCGFGDTTLELARLVGPSGEAVGVDAAERFISTATSEARSLGIANARFFVADVQTSELGGPYDLVFSRFGMMFFASPVAALRNIKRSMKPGAELAFVVWRKKEENPFLFDVEQRVLEIVPHPDKGDQVTCGPGPFSMASPDLVSTQLSAAGFSRIRFERFDADIKVGKSVDEALEMAMSIGPAGEVLRLAGEEGKRLEPQVVASLREYLAGVLTENGIAAGSSTWLITARA